MAAAVVKIKVFSASSYSSFTTPDCRVCVWKSTFCLIVNDFRLEIKCFFLPENQKIVKTWLGRILAVNN